MRVTWKKPLKKLRAVKKRKKNPFQLIYDQRVLHNLQEQDIRLILDNVISTLVFAGRMSEKKTLRIPLFQVFNSYVEVHPSLNPVQYNFTKTNLTAKNVWAQHHYNLVMCGQNVSIPLANYLLDTSSTCLTVLRREKNIYIQLTSTTK